MYRQNFRIIFFFNEAKNAGIAYVLARIFNEIGGKKKLKFPIDNCGLVLKGIKPNRIMTGKNRCSVVPMAILPVVR